MNKQDRWSALSMQERANFIKLLYKKHSISDLEEIRNIYNSFGEGGNTEPLYYDDTYIEPAVVTGYKTPPIIKTLGDYSTYNFINSMIEKNNERYKNNNSKSKSIATKLIPVIIGNSLFNSFGDGGDTTWENVNKFATGGPTGEGTATYNHPKYNHKEEAAIYSYLRERGVPHTQTSAIMGNIAVESMLDPHITQIGGGGGYGLIQATDQPRKNNFINYDGQPYEFGSELDPETQRQLDYIIDKGLNNYTIGEWRKVGKSGARNVRKKFLKESNITKASDLFTKGYLRPGKPHAKRRQSMSNFYNKKYTNPFENEYNNAFLFK